MSHSFIPGDSNWNTLVVSPRLYPNTGGTGAHVLVHPNGTRFTYAQPGVLRQAYLGAHANGEQYQIRLGTVPSVVIGLQTAAFAAAYSLGNLADFDPDSVRRQQLLHIGGHVLIQRGQNMTAALHDADLYPGKLQIFRYLQPNKPGTYHQGAAHPVFCNVAANSIGIGHGAQRHHPGQIYARHGRAQRCRTGREYQFIVRHLHFLPRYQIGYSYGALLWVYGIHLVP